jgi:serine/threonine protein kinase
MRLCPRCQTAHPDDARVCVVDGTPLINASSAATPGSDPSLQQGAVSEVTRMSRPKTGRKQPAFVMRDERAEDAIGRVLGSYKLLECIGRGGMGRVYRAEHVRLGRRVALKLLRPEYAVKRDAVARFFQEAKAVNKIRHRNIVDVTDFVELDDGTTFIIMELLEGVSLGKLQRVQGGLEIPRTLSIVIQVCDALQAAHSEGIVHRDLKPDNIFLSPDENGGELVKLLDFGVAKLLGPNEDSGEVAYRTAAGSVVGTPAYMSPEQAGGMPVDPRSDVYSLGAILYELICGQPVFDAKSFGEFVSKHLHEVPVLPSLTQGGRGIAPHLEHVIMRCLSKKVEERYDVADLKEDLLGLLSVYETGLIPPQLRKALGKAPPTGSGHYPLPPSAPSIPPMSAPTPEPSGRSHRASAPYGSSQQPQQLYPFVPPASASASQPYPGAAYASTPAVASVARGYHPTHETGMAIGDLAGGPPSTARSRRAFGLLALGALSAVGLLAWIVYVLAVRDQDDGTESASGSEIQNEPPPSAVPQVTPMAEASPPAARKQVKLSLKSDPVAGDVFLLGSAAKICRTPCELTIDPNDGASPTRRVYLVKRDGWSDGRVEVPLDEAEQLVMTAVLAKEDAVTKKKKRDRDRKRADEPEEDEEPAPKPKPKKNGSDKIDPTDTMNPFGNK